MRAVAFAAGGELTIKERPISVPGRKVVVIETSALGICGTDTYVFGGEFAGTIFPLVPGDKATATIVKPGQGTSKGVFDFTGGYHVAINPAPRVENASSVSTDPGAVSLAPAMEEARDVMSADKKEDRGR